MKLFPSLKKAYTEDRQPALEAQRLAEFIAFAPMVFQVSRLMLKFGILDELSKSRDGMTEEEISKTAGISRYAAKILLEASLSIGTVKIDDATDRYRISKAGWFLLTDKATRANVDFNHDVNYEGLFHLEESLLEGRPAGLEHFGKWPTIYEALSELPPQVQKSWFGFDHFYSDNSFDKALDIIFSCKPHEILDVGGNTGKWAKKCVEYDPDVRVTIADLPQQIAMMKANVAGCDGADRIGGYGMNLLDPSAQFPSGKHFDIIWMSQFLDCFSPDQIESILSRAALTMDHDSRLCIMETFWDRQRFETSAMCLTLTSVYFTALANGDSKMYHSSDMEEIVRKSGLEVEVIHDGIGYGHSIMVCRAVKPGPRLKERN